MSSNEPTRGDELKAVLLAFDEAIAANPDNASLKARRAGLQALASGAAARLAEIEAVMRDPGLDKRRLKDLLRARERLLAELNEQ